MKKTFLSILLLFSINLICFAQDADKTVSIIVSGSGKTQDEAKQSALRSAIEQSFGAFISSKTEIFNDQVVADQMASVSAGNIQSFTILNESQLPDGSWANTIKAIVSVNKLTSFIQAKGIEIEIKGGLFAFNIKQQLLNEQGEIDVVSEMVGLLHETLQTSIDYSIKSGDPKSLDTESKNWEIPLEVTATANKNMDFCANYFIKTLAALSLSSEEVLSYKNLNKDVYTIAIIYKGGLDTFKLRKMKSLDVLNTLKSNWEFYTRLFTVHSGIDEYNGKGEGKFHKINFDQKYNKYPNRELSIDFLNEGQIANIFSFEDKRTLSQIEQMSGYKVKPRGVISPFKQGGYVIIKANGHGLVVSISDLGIMDFVSAKKACDELTLNGFDDWRLPTPSELTTIGSNLNSKGIGGFSQDEFYWSSYYEEKDYTVFCSILDNSRYGQGDRQVVGLISKKHLVRAVRIF